MSSPTPARRRIKFTAPRNIIDTVTSESSAVAGASASANASTSTAVPSLDNATQHGIPLPLPVNVNITPLNETDTTDSEHSTTVSSVQPGTRPTSAPVDSSRFGFGTLESSPFPSMPFTADSISPTPLSPEIVRLHFDGSTPTVGSSRPLPPLPDANSLKRNGSVSQTPQRSPRPSPSAASLNSKRSKIRETSHGIAAAANQERLKDSHSAALPPPKKPNPAGFFKPIVVPEKPRSAVEQVRDFFLSLRFFFLGMLIASLVTVSVLSWNLTYKAAQDSIALVMQDYSNVLIQEISNDLERRFVAVEHIAGVNARLFKWGLLENDRASGKQELMMRHFKATLDEVVVDTISSLSMTTSNGELQGTGIYFPPNEASYAVRWDQTGLNMTEYRVDSQLNRLSLNFQSETNSTTGLWFTVADQNDVNSKGWTPSYLWFGSFFISQSNTLVNPDNQVIGVTSADMTLNFLDKIAKNVARTSTVGTHFIILESTSGNVLGTSIDGFVLTNNTDPNNPQGKDLGFSGNPELLLSLKQFIIDQSGRDATSPPNQLYMQLNPMHGEFTLSGQRLLVTVQPLFHSVAHPDNTTDSTLAWSQQHSISWVMIHCLDRSQVERQIATSNNNVLISVICICAAFVVAMGLLLWYSLRLIRSLSKLLTSFARFEFRGHVEGGQLKDRSIFVELRQMQDAVMEMTKAFKRHLDGQARMFNRGTNSSYTGHSAGMTPAPVAHAASAGVGLTGGGGGGGGGGVTPIPHHVMVPSSPKKIPLAVNPNRSNGPAPNNTPNSIQARSMANTMSVSAKNTN